MSATVTYKGETLTTATNQTRVLETEGTYLEDDITITDVTGAAPSGTKNISITTNGTTTEDVTSYATASIMTAVPASAVDSGTKSISTNGTHDVIGYASANVAVPNSYSAGDEGKVVSSGALVSQTSDTVTANDTYDTTLINSLTVNVSGSSGIQYKTGTYTPAETYNSTANRQICTVSDIGFTPEVFIFKVTDNSDVSGIQYAVLHSIYDGRCSWNVRTTTRYSNTSNTVTSTSTATSWSNQTNYYLYLNNGVIYLRTTNAYILVKDVSYTWEAYGE